MWSFLSWGKDCREVFGFAGPFENVADTLIIHPLSLAPEHPEPIQIPSHVTLLL